ncbi:MAG: hypothetical protein HY653_08055 [Acidobacteria bacterium]|nr:hypothetical protein [Acidobacteriota bacterium]
MTAFLSWVNRFFDLLFRPFQDGNPLYSLVGASVLTGLFLLAVYRFASDQGGLRRVKDRIQAHLLAVRLFQDQPVVVFQAHGRLLGCIFVYLRYSLKPLAVMLVPLVLTLPQLEMRLGQLPLRVGEPFLLTAKLADPAGLVQTFLRLPRGLVLDSPPVRLPERQEISWRIKAEEAGDFSLDVVVGEAVFSKQVTVGGGVVRLSTKRAERNLWQQWLRPGEPPLPAAGPLEWLEVKYPSRRIDFGPFHTHWLVLFCGFSIVVGLALKGVLGTEM